MFNRNTSKLMALGFALVVLVSGFSIALAAGGVAGQTSSTSLVDSSFTPTNSTQSAYVDVTGVADMNGSGPVSVDVTYEGLNASESAGNGTVLASETLSVSAGSVSSSTYSLADSDTDYDRILVSVETGGDSSLIASTDWGTLEQISGGGGGLLGGSIGGVSLPVIGVVLAGGYFLMGRD